MDGRAISTRGTHFPTGLYHFQGEKSLIGGLAWVRDLAYFPYRILKLEKGSCGSALLLHFWHRMHVLFIPSQGALAWAAYIVLT